MTTAPCSGAVSKAVIFMSGIQRTSQTETPELPLPVTPCKRRTHHSVAGAARAVGSASPVTRAGAHRCAWQWETIPPKRDVADTPLSLLDGFQPAYVLGVSELGLG